jgi:hypothetical protein
MIKSDIIEFMRSRVDEVSELLESRSLECTLSKGGNNLYTYINGIKVEWQIGDASMRLGYGNSTDDIQRLGDLFSTVFEQGSVNTLKNWVDIKPPSIDDFKILVDTVLETTDLDLEKSARGRSTGFNSGVLFEGSNFSNAHERMTTLGPRFMNLVCKATNMTLENMDGEWPIEDNGRIDGVEIDENGNPISIYECQSGIQNGTFLDNEHLSKALLRYPFDSAKIPTLKKIVIIACGYTPEHLNIIKNQAYMFSNCKNPIELVLLKTNRIDDKIGVEPVEYKNC